MYYTGSIYYKNRIYHIGFSQGNITEVYVHGPVVGQTLNLFPLSLEKLDSKKIESTYKINAEKLCLISPKINHYVTDIKGVSPFTLEFKKKLPYGNPLAVGGRVCFVPCKKFEGYVGYELKGVGYLNKNMSRRAPKMKENPITHVYEADFRAWDPHDFFQSRGGMLGVSGGRVEVNGGFFKNHAKRESENLTRFNAACEKSKTRLSDRPLFIAEIPNQFFTKGAVEEEEKLFEENLKDENVKKNGGLVIFGRAVTTPIRFSWLADEKYRSAFYTSIGCETANEKKEYLHGCITKLVEQLLVLLQNNHYHDSLHCQNVRADGCLTDFSDVYEIMDKQKAADSMATSMKLLLMHSMLFVPQEKPDEELIGYFLKGLFCKVAEEKQIKQFTNELAKHMFHPWSDPAHAFLAASCYELMSQK